MSLVMKAGTFCLSVVKFFLSFSCFLYLCVKLSGSSHIPVIESTLTLCLICSERALLNRLMTELHKFDSDVLVGHNISGFDLDVLLHRAQVGILGCALNELV